MRYPDFPIRNLQGLIGVLGRRVRSGGPAWYRGHTDKDYNLVPSLGRDPYAFEMESRMVRKFKQNAYPHLATMPTDSWEWQLLMQHHGAKTRLLDWTENPLAAAYFALTGDPGPGRPINLESRPTTTAAIYCLRPEELNKEALGREEVPLLEADDMDVDSYTLERMKQERSSNLNPIAVMGPRNSARMAAQQGVFTVCHRQPIPLEDVGPGQHVWRLTIAPSHQRNMLRQLKAIGIHRLHLFPELTSAAEEAVSDAR